MTIKSKLLDITAETSKWEQSAVLTESDKLLVSAEIEMGFVKPDGTLVSPLALLLCVTDEAVDVFWDLRSSDRDMFTGTTPGEPRVRSGYISAECSPG